MAQTVAEKVLTNLGVLRYSVNTDDPDGKHVYRVAIGDCWERVPKCNHKDTILAKAIDGALRCALGFFLPGEETIIVSYSASVKTNDSGCEYQVRLQLEDDTKLQATAPNEGLAIFGALWSYYRPNIPLMGALGQLIKSVRFTSR